MYSRHKRRLWLPKTALQTPQGDSLSRRVLTTISNSCIPFESNSELSTRFYSNFWKFAQQ